MSPDFRLSGLAGALALALAAAAPMAASADEPVMATGQVGTKITLGPTNLTWDAENHFLTGMYCEHTWHRLSMQIIAVRSVRRKKLSTRCSARFLLNGIWLNLALPASTGLVCRRRSQQV